MVGGAFIAHPSASAFDCCPLTCRTPTHSAAFGPHSLKKQSIIPTDQGHHAASHERDMSAVASVLPNRFSMSVVKQSPEQAKTQTESIMKRLYQEWRSLAVAANNSDHQSNNTQQLNNHYTNTYNTSSSVRKAHVVTACDPLRGNTTIR
jgi:hypothetical protein